MKRLTGTAIVAALVVLFGSQVGVSAWGQAHRVASFVRMWLVLWVGVAVAAAVGHPEAVELVCAAAGAVKVIVQTDDGAQEMGASHLDCPLCVLTGAPPATPVVA